MAALPGGWPTLSQLCTSQFDYLQRFADWCERIAGVEETLQRLAREVRAPGGVEWEGEAADAAITQAETDVFRARPFLWSVADAAVIARNGQDMLEAGRRAVLDAVDDAERDGFVVQEDYSVTDTRRCATRADYQQRLGIGAAHSDYIRHRVAGLVSNEQWLNSQLKQATSGWGTLTFEEPNTADTSAGDNHHTQAQPVDHHWKQDPAPKPPPGPSGDDIRRVLDKLPVGDSPEVREVRSQQDLDNLWNWMTQNGVDNPNRYGDPAKGEWKDLPDGSGVGRRGAARSTNQPVLDVRLPGKDGYVKVHVNPRGGVPDIPASAGPGSASVISAPPNLPPVLAHPPVTAVPPTEANHPPVAVPPSVLDHPPLPPWLQNPSPPGFDVHPGEPPLFAPMDTPGEAIPPPQHGPLVILHLPQVHAPDMPPPTPEQQRGFLGIVGAFVLGGLAALGRLGEGLK
ncbi:MAG: hypothetical protein QJR12_13890 [Mycobacterium sp.]|uniref:hypothetical protein n=1 Tax=Mycobacterium sp. TaxID=1785 RepID=UPI00260DE2BA|nr:hypothetical protein [Mycobacterium sp.]MDI3315310.1 hypothetical protein [Mycobacterium sp.]